LLAVARKQQTRRLLLFLAVILAAITMMLLVVPQAKSSAVALCKLDWDVFRRATHDLFSGRNPYQASSDCGDPYLYPIWALLILAPFTLLPRMVGYGLWIVTSLIALWFICRRFGQSRWDYLLVVLSAPSMLSLMYGNIDFLAFFGVFLPLPIGMTLFMIKPQNSIGLMVILLYREYREHGLKQVLLAILPVSVLLALNVLIFGLPHSDGLKTGFGVMFPWAVVPGLMLLYKAFKADDASKASAASPLLTPYSGINNTLCVMFAFRGMDLLIASWLSWLVLIFYY
jgi:hypothetical protein